MTFNTGNRVYIAGVLVVVTIKAEVFPVASIGRIVVVIMVSVVHGQFVQVLASELAPASPTHPGVNLEGLRPIVSLAGISIPDGLGDNRIQIVF
mgnify:CR=1 FL=1